MRARAVDTSGNHSAWGECDHPFSVNNNMDDVPTANAPSPDEPVDDLTGSLLTTISESSILDDGGEDTKEADETIIFTLSNTNNAKVDMPNTDVLTITDVVDDNDGKLHTGVGKTLPNISKAENDNDTTVINNAKDLDDVHRVTDLETEE